MYRKIRYSFFGCLIIHLSVVGCASSPLEHSTPIPFTKAYECAITSAKRIGFYKDPNYPNALIFTDSHDFSLKVILYAKGDMATGVKSVEVSSPPIDGSGGVVIVNREEFMSKTYWAYYNALRECWNETGKTEAPPTLTATADNNTGSVTDIDGNVYKTVKIGNQVWTVENLRTTKYNDGSAIPQVTDSNAWAALTTPGYCYYNNTIDADSIKKHGALYNWYAVDTKKLAPKGWHVPTDTEWTILENYLIANGYNWDGTTTGNKIAKSMAAKADWNATTDPRAIGYDLTKNNRSGFSALPGGCRSRNGSFSGIGNYGFWWSATESVASYAYNRNLVCDFGGDLFRYSFSKSFSFSVRLVRD